MMELERVYELTALLKEKKLTVAFAESCTGGLLSASLTSEAGVSSVYLGSVVSYADQVKLDVLRVQEQTLKQFGAVSVQVAEEMAKGARLILKSDFALSITGIAGPGGATPDKPVGTVCFAVAGPGGFVKVHRALFTGDRNHIQQQSVGQACVLLMDSICGV